MLHCFDIGGSRIKAAVARSGDDVRLTATVATPRDDFATFVSTVAGIVADHGGPREAAVAVSIAGVVDPETQRIAVANIPGLHGLALAPDLGRLLGRRVFVANDADCFALAEAGAGAGRGHGIVFGIILGTGVGGGIVIEGRLVKGPGGFAGEWGHGPVSATLAGDPPVQIPRFRCGCGQIGCVDTVGGARGLERIDRHLHGRDLDSVAITAAWSAGDAMAARTVDCYVDLVAGPLALVINTLGASVVPVGGGLAEVPALIARLDEAVRARILRRTDRPLVVPGICGIEAGLVGAAHLGFAEQR